MLSVKNETQIRLMVAKTGMSLREFSKYAGLSHAYLSQIISCKKKPSPKIGYKIANALGVEIEDIFLVQVSVNSEHVS